MSQPQVPLRPDWDLFAPPPEPPSGPATDPRKFTGEPPDVATRYAAWKASKGGWRAWRYMEATALDLAARGELRISVKYLAEQARRALEPKVELDNRFTARIADDLVARHPHLEALIERRKRRAGERAE